MNVAQPVIIFLESCVLGFFLGILYDVFRILRFSFYHGKILVFVEDILYFFLITIISFTFILLQNNGILRVFVLLGELLGVILYFFTLSVIIMRIAHIIIRFVKMILKSLYKIFVKPIIILFGIFKKKIYLLISFFKKKCKFISLNCKKHLKQSNHIVYNDINRTDDSSYFTP